MNLGMLLIQDKEILKQVVKGRVHCACFHVTILLVIAVRKNQAGLFFNAACYIRQSLTFFDCLVIYVSEEMSSNHPAFLYTVK